MGFHKHAKNGMMAALDHYPVARREIALAGVLQM
jgi:hypothetical protein